MHTNLGCFGEVLRKASRHAARSTSKGHMYIALGLEQKTMCLGQRLSHLGFKGLLGTLLNMEVCLEGTPPPNTMQAMRCR